jgi:hypothetical protein
VQVREDVEPLGLLDGDQRLPDELLVQLVREVGLEALAVQGELAGAGHETHPDHGLLAAADRLHGPVDEDRGDLRDVPDLGLVVVGRVGAIGLVDLIGLDGGLLDGLHGLDHGLGGGHGLSLFRVFVAGRLAHCATWVISKSAGFCAECGCSGPA